MDLEGLVEALSLDDDLANEPVKERTFNALIKNNATHVMWNEYRDYHCIWATQPQTVGKAVACRITLSEPPPVDVTSEAGFSIYIRQKDQYGFRDAAKFIAIRLEIKKPLFLYLCLPDFQVETVIELVEVLLNNR